MRNLCAKPQRNRAMLRPALRNLTPSRNIIALNFLGAGFRHATHRP
jgi:hypothetical protein